MVSKNKKAPPKGKNQISGPNDAAFFDTPEKILPGQANADTITDKQELFPLKIFQPFPVPF